MGDSKAQFEKGQLVAITSGKKDVGVHGTVFWTGPNKFGEGLRYGIKDADGNTYWVDGSNLGAPSSGNATSSPSTKTPRSTSSFAKGDEVEIVGGKDGVGRSGNIFWIGDSRFGKGMRFGVRAGAEETYWVDEEDVRLVTRGSKKASPTSAPPIDDSPIPEDFIDHADDNEDFGSGDDDLPF